MTDYYNEFDPYAADCLENLIRDGLIPHGIVDRRSIEDVAPSDLADFNRCHFFAGIGGWALALSLAGWTDRTRRLWTGSCPCQPFSAAGAGGGFDDERHLWPHFHWLIDKCRPEIVLGEQVASKNGLGWLDLVSSDLEGSGYAQAAVDLCAAGFSAAHIRQRLYWIGVEHGRHERRGIASGRGDGGMGHAERGVSGRLPGETLGTQAQGRGFQEPGYHGFVDASAGIGGMGHTISGRQSRESGGCSTQKQRTAEHGVSIGLADADLRECNGITNGEGCQSDRTPTGRQQGDGQSEPGGDGSGMADANGGDTSTERQQRLVTADCGDGGDHRPHTIDGDWRVADWLWCRDEKFRPVEPGTFPLVDGLPAGLGTVDAGIRRMAEMAGLDGTSLRRAKSYRTGALKGYGNALDIHTAAEFCHIVKEVIQS